MKQETPAQPALLSKLNEQQVLRTLLVYGSLTRAELARVTRMTAPTVSKAVEAQLSSGFLEEQEPEAAFGRPARKLRLAGRNAQVLGLVIDAGWCRVVSSGLDGQLSDERTREFPTPGTYEELISAAAEETADLLGLDDVTTLGIGVSIPGLVDYQENRCLLSPNLPISNGRTPAIDLENRLGVKCILLQEEHALCLAERCFGNAKGLDNFAMLDVSTGVGLGVISGGRLLMGHRGLAGEIGHLTVELRGRQCGCGNYGCLETVACDSALAWMVSDRLGRRVTIDEVIVLAQRGELHLDETLNTICEYLAIGLAAVVNLFNPSALFVYGRLFSIDERFFTRVVQRVKERALPPSYADCHIVQARGSKRQGALAGIIEHLIDFVVPARTPQTAGSGSEPLVSTTSRG